MSGRIYRTLPLCIADFDCVASRVWNCVQTRKSCTIPQIRYYQIRARLRWVIVMQSPNAKKRVGCDISILQGRGDLARLSLLDNVCTASPHAQSGNDPFRIMLAYYRMCFAPTSMGQKLRGASCQCWSRQGPPRTVGHETDCWTIYKAKAEYIVEASFCCVLMEKCFCC